MGYTQKCIHRHSPHRPTFTAPHQVYIHLTFGRAAPMAISDPSHQVAMPKKVRFEGERAFGRIALNELTDDRVSSWTVRAVAGETRKFTRPDATKPAANAADDAVSSALAQVALRVADQKERPAVGLRCGTCEITAFASLNEQYAHFKSDWHCFNLKRKGRGASVLSESEFLAKTSIKVAADADSDASSGDAASSSSSGSSEEEEEEDVATTTEPVVEFSDGKSVFKVFKNILPNADKEEFNPFVSLDQIRTSRFRWAVFLLRSGRFAGAVFDKDKALCHKTFQRYTTRRKQGGSQAAHDAAGGKAKSAGATLRRYNEAALKQDVADLLTQWQDVLRDTELIFISCGRSDRPTFFVSKPPVLQPDDSRLRRISFATFRPTFEEVCRVRSELSSVKFAPLPPAGATDAEAAPKKPSSTKSKAVADALKLSVTSTVKEEEGAPVVVPQLIQRVVVKDLAEVKALLHGDHVDVNEVDVTYMTALHHAAEQNAVSIIEYLLDHGANPSLLDLRTRPAYFLCTTKETRNVFRRFMAANPDAWDYSASQIPSGLTDEMEQKKKEKEAEKRRRAKERKKEQKKEEAEQKQREEKAQAERERQVAAGLACDSCGKFAGKSPFKRLEFKYCSTECVNLHKRRLMSEAALKRFGG